MDKYELGQSPIACLNENSKEIRLDLELTKNRYYNYIVIYGYVIDMNNCPINGAKVIFLNKQNKMIGGVYSRLCGFYSYNGIMINNEIRVLAYAQGYKYILSSRFIASKEKIQYNIILGNRVNWRSICLCGHIFDDNNNAIKDTPVYLLRKKCNKNIEVYKSTHANQYGQFVFDEIPRLYYYILINDPKYYIYCKAITTTAKKSIININLTIKKKITNTEINGKITDSFGKVIPFALVMLYKVEENHNMVCVKTTNCDVFGQYRFINVPFGKYLVKSKEGKSSLICNNR